MNFFWKGLQRMLSIPKKKTLTSNQIGLPTFRNIWRIINNFVMLFRSEITLYNIILHILSENKPHQNKPFFVMLAKKLQHPRQNVRKKGKLIWEQAVFHTYLYLVLDGIHILLSKYIHFYANLCTRTVLQKT